MDKPWTTLRVAHRLPTGRRLPTSSTAHDLIRIKSGKVKTISTVQPLAYSTPVAVQATVTTAVYLPREALADAAAVNRAEHEICRQLTRHPLVSSLSINYRQRIFPARGH